MAKADPSDSIVKEALERFEESQSVIGDDHKDAEADIRFARLSEQWPEEILKVRQQEGRPALTINKLPPLIRQVVNEARQNKPGITVKPVDNGADKDTAGVISGLIRSIERIGPGAGVAYDTAIDHAVSGGFGFFRIAIDYAHEDSFNMECQIRRIPNPLMVHWDPNSTEFDASDWEYGFISDVLSEKTFEKRYPNAAKVSFQGDDSAKYAPDWLTEGSVRIAEYFLRDEHTAKLIEFEKADGGLIALREDRIPNIAKRVAEQGGLDVKGIKDDELARLYVEMSGLVPTGRERETKFYTVKRRIMSGVEILDEDDWPGSTIPICPVWGEEVIINKRRHFRSMIRDAKDPQTMHNFWRSATTELVALAPRAPWVGPKNFVPRGQEDKWMTANTRSHAYLEYEPSSGPPPERQSFAGVPAGALQEAVSANEDMQAITGIYPSSIGAKSNETSGKAILTRERQGDISNFHFTDNLSRAIKYAGQILVEIIPSVYTQRETVRILGEDMKEKVVKLGTLEGNLPIDGEERLYDLSIGKYDVEVKQGPSYGTQREETRETLIEIMTRVPDAAPILGDVLMEHMDFQGAEKVAERLKMLLPPQIQAAEGIVPPPMPMGAPIPGGPQPNMAPVPPGTPIPGAPPAQPGNPPAMRPQGAAPGL